MTTRMIGGNVWDQVELVCRRGRKRKAAVAYVGIDAPNLMPLRRGDVLVVNASRGALLARATHPDALAAYLERGVRLFSTPRLHAKVVTTSSEAVVGSANASMNSTQLDEAVVITNSPVVIQVVRQFIMSFPI
jgi:phosphatidylserine/phosphatidylglycerophosphate/cardiolipin synthase-like enzyme